MLGCRLSDQVVQVINKEQVGRHIFLPERHSPVIPESFNELCAQIARRRRNHGNSRHALMSRMANGVEQVGLACARGTKQ
jgi:hypothetical protein